MKSGLARFLGVYKRYKAWKLKRKGMTFEDEAAERIVLGKTWDDFCETLKSAGNSIIGFDAPGDPFTQAEGYRYLTRLLRGGLEAFLEYNDPKAPVLRRMVHETVKMGADNPDNYYQNASISGAYEYRLYGSRGTVHFLGFSTQIGNYGENGGMPPSGFLDAADMEIGEDGRFEIIMSREKKEGNWLPMSEDTGTLIIRQTFMDRDRERPAEISIERTGGDGKPSALTAEKVDTGLMTAANLVAGASLLFAKWAADFRKHVNELPRFDPEKSTRAGGDPKIAYYHSYWSLGAGEALIIEAEPPECATWNFQLNNHWMESLDYRYYTIHINKHTAEYRRDGSVCIVVAHEDPGTPNWITTAGHSRGTMCFRWVKADRHPRPGTRVVPLEDVPRVYRDPGPGPEEPPKGARNR